MESTSTAASSVPRLKEQSTTQLDPIPSTIPDPHTGYPHYTHIAANSGSIWNNAVRRLSLHMQIGGAQWMMNLWNTLKIYRHENYLKVIGPARPKNQPLITVSNHQSTLDDPALLAAVTPYSVMTDLHHSRWGWCAREMCFPTPFIGWFFLHGKIFPIVRGLGLNQKGVAEADEHLRKNEWMHIFPEGKCIPVTHGIGQLRWGIGKLIADGYKRSRECEQLKSAFQQSANLSSAPAPATSSSALTAASFFPSDCSLPPVVFPMVHHGMTRVMPFYHTIPKRGHTVRCLMGQPIQFDDIIEFHEKNQVNRIAFDFPTEHDLYIDLTQRVRESLVDLDQQLLQIEKEEGEPDPIYPPQHSWYHRSPSHMDRPPLMDVQQLALATKEHLVNQSTF